MPFKFPFVTSPERLISNRDLVAQDLQREVSEPNTEEAAEGDRSAPTSKLPNLPAAPMPPSEY